MVERSLHYKQHILAAFLYIEGIFKSVSTKAIKEALPRTALVGCLVHWIVSMLKNLTEAMSRGTLLQEDFHKGMGFAAEDGFWVYTVVIHPIPTYSSIVPELSKKIFQNQA